MSKTIKLVVGILGGVVILAVLVGAALVGVHAAAAQGFGQSGTPDAPPDNNGDANPGARPAAMFPGFHEFVHEYVEEAQAKALGMTDAEFHDAILSGKTLRDLVEEKGIDPAEFRTTMQTARKDAVTEAVAKGLITQEQADFILQHMEAHPGGPGHRGPHGQGSNGSQPPANP